MGWNTEICLVMDTGVETFYGTLGLRICVLSFVLIYIVL